MGLVFIGNVLEDRFVICYFRALIKLLCASRPHERSDNFLIVGEFENCVLPFEILPIYFKNKVQITTTKCQMRILFWFFVALHMFPKSFSHILSS